LKEWHQQHSKNLESKITTVNLQISSPDIRGEEYALLEEEEKELRKLSVSLHSMPRVQTSINWQRGEVI